MKITPIFPILFVKDQHKATIKLPRPNIFGSFPDQSSIFQEISCFRTVSVSVTQPPEIWQQISHGAELSVWLHCRKMRSVLQQTDIYLDIYLKLKKRLLSFFQTLFKTRSRRPHEEEVKCIEFHTIGAGRSASLHGT